MFRILFRLLPWLLLLLTGWWLLKYSGLFTPDEPKVQVTHNTLITEIKELGRLELVQYSFKDVVEYKKELSRFLPDSKAILIVEGEAIGCLDLTKIREQDIVADGDTLYINLPKPELCTYKIDHSKSRVFRREYTYFKDVELAEEAYRYAEENIKRTALNSGILDQTLTNADKILQPMLEKLSGKKVILLHNEQRSLPAVPR
jgi:hypothetical protein